MTTLGEDEDQRCDRSCQQSSRVSDGRPRGARGSDGLHAERAVATAVTAPASPAEAATVPVTLTEWAVEPGVAEAGAGEVAFSVENEGELLHNFVVYRTELAPAQLPVEGGLVIEGDAVDEVGRIDEVAPGASQSLTLELERGVYVVVCNLPGHYELGMHAAFTVAD